MRQFGPYQVSVRLPGDPETTEEDLGQEIAEVVAEHFDIPVHRPGGPPRSRPGVTVRHQPENGPETR